MDGEADVISLGSGVFVGVLPYYLFPKIYSRGAEYVGGEVPGGNGSLKWSFRESQVDG